MKTETIINLMFDANRGSVSQLSREGVLGEPFGQLPTPTRRGYTFLGWYHGDVLVNSDSIIETDEDIRLVARWEKAAPITDKKRSMLKRQKTAIVVLAAVSVALIITFIIVSQLISIYHFYDTDGSKYYVKRQDGVYKLFDDEGNPMPTNGKSETIFTALKSGNEYKIDPETGEHTLRAIVDAEGVEYASGTILLMFPQIRSEYLYSIEMKNEQGGDYTLYRTADGIKIKGFEKSNLELDEDLYAKLCFSCGYMLSNRKIKANADDPMIPIDKETGKLDYAVYGLDEPQATYTISQMLFEKNADGSDKYRDGKYVIAYDAEGKPQADPKKTYTVSIGDAILSGAGYYVRLAYPEGKESVYIVTTDYIEDTILQPIESLVVPRVVYPVSVSYHSMGKDFSLGRLPTLSADKEDVEQIVAFTYSELEERINTMNATRPYLQLQGNNIMSGYNINENSAISVFENFYSIEATSCLRIGITAETLAEFFDADKEVYVLTYKTFSGQYENGNPLYAQNDLLMQKNEDGNYNVAAYEFDMIVEVDRYYLSFLEWDDIKWYNEAFIFHNIAYVRDMKVEFNGKSFGLSEDKVYEFDLDNSLSYSYYVNEKNEFKSVNLSEGMVYTEGNKTIYKVNGKSYDVVARVNLDEVTVVDNKEIAINPTLTDVVYVPETFYYTNAKGENVNVYPDYATKNVEYKFEKNEKGEIIGGHYYYTDLTLSEPILVQRSLGDPVFRYSYQGNMYEATLGVTAAGLLVSCNGQLLNYDIPNIGIGDDGQTKYETVTATDNFRRLHLQLLYFSLMGDVDPVEFAKANGGMSVEQFLASDNKQPMATISMHVEDYARALNGHTTYDENGQEVRFHKENKSQYLVYNFYQYSDWKVLVTIEEYEKGENGELVPSAKDEEGNPIVVGKFYASTAILDKLVSDINRLLNKELIDSATKY